MGDQLRFQDDSGDTRLAGELYDDGAAVGDVLTVQSDGSIAAASSGGSSAAIPQGDPSGTTIDTTTYDNPITGSGKLTTLVLPADTAIEAVAVTGDDFPRALLADPTDGWYFGDGTVDPYTEQAEFNTFTHTNYGKQLLAFPAVTVNGMTIFSQSGAPTIGGNVGDFYIRRSGDPTANTYLYACTTAGAAGDAVWTALVTS